MTEIEEEAQAEEPELVHPDASTPGVPVMTVQALVTCAICLVVSQALIWIGGLLVSVLIGPWQAFTAAMFLEIIILVSLLFYFMQHLHIQDVLYHIATFMGNLVELREGEYADTQQDLDMILSLLQDHTKILEQNDTRLAAIEARDQSVHTKKVVRGTTQPQLKTVPAAETKVSGGGNGVRTTPVAL